MKVYDSILETIGKTPLVRLLNVEKEFNLNVRLIAKVEAFNPGRSIKDRIAYSMVKDALDKGKINKDSTIIEATSGNTGIGLALTCAALGMKLVICMPENMSLERRQLLKAYGAELVLTKKELGMNGAVKESKRLLKEIPNSLSVKQFENRVNPKTHYKTTAKEIFKDLDGQVDVFVAGIGTGGTLTGVSKFLKGKNPNTKVIGVEPATSPLLTKGVAGPHKIQGIGANFVPKTLSLEFVDEIIDVTNEDAYTNCNMLAKKEGLLVGISSAAALTAAIEYAKKNNLKDKNVVIIFPDSGERYLSTGVFDDQN